MTPGGSSMNEGARIANEDMWRSRVLERLDKIADLLQPVPLEAVLSAGTVPAAESPPKPRNHTGVTSGPSEAPEVSEALVEGAAIGHEMAVHRLNPEIERLRAALRQIQAMADSDLPGETPGPNSAGWWLDQIGNVAQDALALLKPDSQPGGGE